MPFIAPETELIQSASGKSTGGFVAPKEDIIQPAGALQSGSRNLKQIPTGLQISPLDKFIAAMVPTLTGAEQVTKELSDPYNIPGHTINAAVGRSVVPEVVGTKFSEGQPKPQTIGEGLQSLPSHFADMLTDPKTLAQLPAIGGGEIAKLLMGLGLAMGGTQAASEAAAPDKTLGERTVSTADAILAALGAKSLVKPKPKTGSELNAGDVNAKTTASDVDQIQGRVPPERQIGPGVRFEGGSQSVPMTDVSQLSPFEKLKFELEAQRRSEMAHAQIEKKVRQMPEGERYLMIGPGVRFIGGSQSAPIVDVSQMSPFERLKFELEAHKRSEMAHAQKEDIEKKVRQMPEGERYPIIGERGVNAPFELSKEELSSLQQRLQARQIVKPTSKLESKPIENVEGGKISFGSPAKAEAVPSARQAAQIQPQQPQQVKEGVQNAVQIEETKGVPVRESSGNSETLGEGNRGETFQGREGSQRNELSQQTGGTEGGGEKGVAEKTQKGRGKGGGEEVGLWQQLHGGLEITKENLEDLGKLEGTSHKKLTPESGSILMEPVVNGTKKLVDQVSQWASRRPAIDQIKRTKDATINIARNKANEITNDVKGPALRDFGLKDPQRILKAAGLSPVYRRAKTAYDNLSGAIGLMRESGLDRKVLEKQLDEVKSKAPESKDKEAFIRYAQEALNNWDKYSKHVEKYGKALDQEVKWERDSGHHINYVPNYMMHLADDTSDMTSFTQKRNFATLADRLIAGKKAGSFDSLELLRSRLQKGQQLYVQSKVFDKLMEGMKAPGSGENILKKWKEGQEIPKGYVVVDVAGTKRLVKEGYKSIVTAIYDPSIFTRGQIGPVLMKARGVQKHVKLLFDTVHMARIGKRGLEATAGDVVKGKLPEITKGLLIRDRSPEEIQVIAKEEGWTKEETNEALRRKRVSNLLTTEGFNTGRTTDAFNQHWAEKLPATGDFTRYLFDVFQAGLMEDVGYKAYDVYRKQWPKLSEREVARKVSHDINVAFGNLGKQGLLTRASYRDLAQLFFLAPNWTEGEGRFEAGAVKGAVKGIYDTARTLKEEGVLRPQFNMQSRMMGTGVVAYLTLNALINEATTGSPMRKEEGHELDSKIGDFYLDPTASSFELTHGFEKALVRDALGGKVDDVDSVSEAFKDVLGGHLSAGMQPVASWITGKKYGLTGPMEKKEGQVGRLIKGEVFPSPIGAQGVADYIKGKGGTQEEKQLLNNLIGPVDIAPSERQQTMQLARKWKKANGVKEDEGSFPESDYLDLNNALRRGDMKVAKEQIERLKEEGGKNDKQLEKYYETYAKYRFTGSKEREEEFYSSLNEEQKNVYDKAKGSNQEVSNRFFQIMGTSPEEVKEVQKKKGNKKGRSSIFN
jgi:hypothetical protein